MRFSILFSMMIILSNTVVFSQHQDIGEQPSIWRGEKNIATDTTSLLYAFKSGNLKGHFRYFFSHTDNNTGLTDYYANAAGGGLRYETGSFHGFQIGVSGF
ncbi:MAG TPA: hypothetical protein PKD85_20645, partial [Saprospiraceae bacterium]|nr:hypothetical protein [Saprospiraceae bacterium]